jgi:hypothetical protein
MSSSKAEVQVYDLKYPVTFANETIVQVQIRKRSKWKDIRPYFDFTTGATRKLEFSDKGQVDMNDLGIIAHRMCGVDPRAWDEFDLEDAQPILEIVQGFLSKSSPEETSSQKTSMTSSPSSPGDLASQQES